MDSDSCIADSVEIHSIVRKLCAKERGLTRGNFFKENVNVDYGQLWLLLNTLFVKCVYIEN